MKVVHYTEAQKHEQRSKDSSLPDMIALEYATGSSKLNIAEVTLTSRYPKEGWVWNTECDMIVYVVDGEGWIEIDGGERERIKGRSVIYIKKNQRYFWDVDGTLTLVPAATPAWTPEQHRHGK